MLLTVFLTVASIYYLAPSESYLHKMGTPDTDRELSVRDVVRLDAAFRRAGGEGAFARMLSLKLDLQMPAAPATASTMLSGA